MLQPSSSHSPHWKRFCWNLVDCLWTGLDCAWRWSLRWGAVQVDHNASFTMFAMSQFSEVVPPVKLSYYLLNFFWKWFWNEILRPFLPSFRASMCFPSLSWFHRHALPLVMMSTCHMFLALKGKTCGFHFGWQVSVGPSSRCVLLGSLWHIWHYPFPDAFFSARGFLHLQFKVSISCTQIDHELPLHIPYGESDHRVILVRLPDW